MQYFFKDNEFPSHNNRTAYLIYFVISQPLDEIVFILLLTFTLNIGINALVIVSLSTGNYYFEKIKNYLTFALLFLNRRIVENNHEKNVSALTKEKKK